MIGAVAVLSPMALLPVIAVWLVLVMLFGFVGLATIVASVTLPVALALMEDRVPAPVLAFAVGVALFIVWTHRSNIARMRSGTENRVKRLWLLRPRDSAR